MPAKVPGTNSKVYLNRQGMRELLRSNAIQATLEKRMVPVQNALPGSNLEAKMRPTRVVVIVSHGDDYDEANTGNLSRALSLSGGARGTKTKFKSSNRRGA
jgi:hypothetical protein